MRNFEESADADLRDKLSDEEKKEIAKSLLETIGIDYLKKELYEELKKEKYKASEFFKHPTILLLLGFIFTSVVGTYLSARYQSNEWRKQQAFLSRQRYVEQKQIIADEAIKAIVETLSSADDVSYLFYWETSEADEKSRQDRWRQTSSKWRGNHHAISQKLAVYFNGEVCLLFDEIVTERYTFSAGVDNLIEYYNKDKKNAQSKQPEAKEIIDKIKEIREGKFTQLTKLMAEEILADRNPQERSFISFL